MKHVRALALGLLIPAAFAVPVSLVQPLSAQEAPAAPQVIATGRHAQGTVIGEVDGLVVDGDRLTVKMTLKPVQPGSKVNVVAYSGAASSLEQIYLTSGDKKYMLVTDDQNQPLASNTLSASGSGDVVGLWYGVFPLPPAGQTIMLYLPDFEPIGPFTLPTP